MLDIEGCAFDCGVMLGQTWREQITLASQGGTKPWMSETHVRKLVERRAPHLADIWQGMAKGAGVSYDDLAPPRVANACGGCTSFAIHPSATLDGHLICGQTKDAPAERHHRYVMLRLNLSDAPPALTVTYAGMLFGHGFVSGGCAVFRNDLHAGKRTDGELPYEIWGLLALHCRTVDDVVDLTERHGVAEPFHCTITDEHGGIAGIESGTGGVAVNKPRRGVYVHANHVTSCTRLSRHEDATRAFLACSKNRQQRLHARLSIERGRLTPQLAYAAMCDHEGYPASLCNHISDDFMTSASITAEPTQRRMWVTRGNPCQNWPTEYRL